MVRPWQYPAASMNREGHFPFTHYLPGIVSRFYISDEEYFRYVDKVLHLPWNTVSWWMMTPLIWIWRSERRVVHEVFGKRRCPMSGIRPVSGQKIRWFPNIVWIMDGDRNPDDLSRPLELEILQGIKDSIRFICFPPIANQPIPHAISGKEKLGLIQLRLYLFLFPLQFLCSSAMPSGIIVNPRSCPLCYLKPAYETNTMPCQSDQAQMYWGWAVFNSRCTIWQSAHLAVWPGMANAMDWQVHVMPLLW